MSREVEFTDSIEDFVFDHMAKWETENPCPNSDVPEPPELPRSVYIETENGYFVVRPNKGSILNLIIGKDGSESLFVTLQVNELRELLEAILEIQTDMENYQEWSGTWAGEYKESRKLRDDWKRRHREAEKEARRIFIAQFEERKVVQDTTD